MFAIEFTAEWIAAVSVAFTTFISSVVAAIIALRQAFTKQTQEVTARMDEHNATVQTAIHDVATKVDDVQKSVNGGIS